MRERKPSSLNCLFCGSQDMAMSDSFIDEVWVQCFDCGTTHIVSVIVEKVKYMDNKTGMFKVE